jgi:group I intron endonuclease
MIGVYRIVNTANGDAYYGSSKDVDKRLIRHRNELQNNKHHNSHLQRAWDKYGNENFTFELVEECTFDLLLQTEQHYLDKNPAYNIGLKASGGDNLSKNPDKIDIIERIRTTVKLTFDSMTAEEKKFKFSRPQELNPNWRNGSSVKYCKCGKEIAPINKTCRECRDRNKEKNPFYEKTHTKEAKDKIAAQRIGKYFGEQNKPIIIDGVKYRSASYASTILNIPMVTIRWRVLSLNKKFAGYQYE